MYTPGETLNLASTWTLPLSRFALTWGWHCPHVCTRLLGWIDEWGSDAAKIRWLPWQLEQLAAMRLPYLTERP